MAIYTGLIQRLALSDDEIAAVTLWNKMAGQSAGAPPQWLSTHPSHATRQKDLAEYAARVMPLYQGARR